MSTNVLPPQFNKYTRFHQEPNSELVLNESEQVIADSLLPNLIENVVVTRKFREFFSLLVRNGDLNIMLLKDPTLH